MSKINVPTELKDFHNVFSKLAYARTDSEVFDDYLLWIIAGFSHDIKWLPRHTYTPEQCRLFWDLFKETVLLMQRKLISKKWYDPFGTYYESYISSHGRRASAGQFFTPENVVDFMVEIESVETRCQQGIEDLTGLKIRVSDLTCGSGRMLIAFHAKNPGNLLYGEDIDRTCCLMAVCNFLLHGTVGEVVWHNSLDPGSYQGGWKVNETLNSTGIPIVRAMEKEESFCYRSWLRRCTEKKEKQTRIEVTLLPEEVKKKKRKPGDTQLSFMFEE